MNNNTTIGKLSVVNCDDEDWLSTTTAGKDLVKPKADGKTGTATERSSLKTQSMNTESAASQKQKTKKRPLSDTEKNGEFQQLKKRKPNGALGTRESIQALDEIYHAKPEAAMVLKPNNKMEKLEPWDCADTPRDQISQCTHYVDQIINSWKYSGQDIKATVKEEVKITNSDGSTSNTFEEWPMFPIRDYFNSFQTDLKPRMRTILFSWMVEVHQKFKLRETTLWTGFQICDNFLSLVNVHRNRLQLVGSCCLWIASKYQDIYPPLAKDFVYISDKAFERPDLMKCEELICNKLGFNFTKPTVYSFLTRYIKVAIHPIKKLRRKSRVKFLSLYAAERVMLEHAALKFSPDRLAAGLLCTCLGMTGSKWSSQMAKYTGYGIKELKSTCRLTRKTVLKFDDQRHKAVIKKYMNPSKGAVSKLRKK